MHTDGHLFIALLVYVDDMIITSNNPNCVTALKSLLDKNFGIKDLVSLKFFLGLEIARSEKGISLNQRKYALEILIEADMFGCKGDRELLQDVGQYRRLIGKLIYLTLSRPNITYAMHRLSQFLSQSKVPHIRAVTRILQYIKGTLG